MEVVHGLWDDDWMPAWPPRGSSPCDQGSLYQTPPYAQVGHSQPSPDIPRDKPEQWSKSDLKVSRLLPTFCTAQEGIFLVLNDWSTHWSGPNMDLELTILPEVSALPLMHSLNHAWNKGYDKVAIADKNNVRLYLLAQAAIVLGWGSERNFLQLTLTRIRDLICSLLRACNLISEFQSKVFGLT